MEFTKELVNKAKACKSAEELLALAKENEIELTKEDAEAFLDEFREGELTDEELDNVAGGVEGCKPPNRYEEILWDKKEDVQFIFNVGDIVQAFATGCVHHTATCKVVNRTIGGDVTKFYKNYRDEYYLEKQPGVKSCFVNGWHPRSHIEK